MCDSASVWQGCARLNVRWQNESDHLLPSPRLKRNTVVCMDKWFSFLPDWRIGSIPFTFQTWQNQKTLCISEHWHDCLLLSMITSVLCNCFMSVSMSIYRAALSGRGPKGSCQAKVAGLGQGWGWFHRVRRSAVEGHWGFFPQSIVSL